MLPMTTGYAESDQSTGDRLIDYYAARAQGGAGLIIAPFSPSPAGSPVDAGLYDDRFIPGARKLADTVHQHGAKISAQLIVCYHLILPAPAGKAGRAGTAAEPSDFDDGGDPGGIPEVVGPSPVTNTLLKVKPRKLTVEEIAFIVREYGKAAARAKKAGFDMVEIMAGGGYLVNRFLSPLSNIRGDEYGGDLEKRMRFLLEIIGSVRTSVGEDFPITLRLNLQENIDGGYTLDDALEMAAILERTGIAGFTSYVGRHESPIPTVQASVPKGAFVSLAERLKKTVRVPVTAANRIDGPVIAERILAEGKADLVGMGRALLADPELPDKARTGRTEEIVPCLACSHCLAAMLTTYKQWGRPASAVCSVNPTVGRERDCRLERAPRPKKVVVIGGGPAGLEAARVAALRGHDVSLHEKTDRLGGRLLTGAVPPHKEALGALAASLATRAERAGVRIRTTHTASRHEIAGEHPDAVVVAVGGTPSMPGIPGADGSNVVIAEGVLTGAKTVRGEVVVIGGGMVGCETAEYIWSMSREHVDAVSGERAPGEEAADRESTHGGTAAGPAQEGAVTGVTIVEMLDRMAADVSATTRPFLLARLKGQGIRMITGARVVAIDPRGVTLARTAARRGAGTEGSMEAGGALSERVPADLVVLATGYQVDPNAVRELAELAPETYIIGDCAGPRMVREALEEGLATGLSL